VLGDCGQNGESGEKREQEALFHRHLQQESMKACIATGNALRGEHKRTKNDSAQAFCMTLIVIELFTEYTHDHCEAALHEIVLARRRGDGHHSASIGARHSGMESTVDNFRRDRCVRVQRSCTQVIRIAVPADGRFLSGIVMLGDAVDAESDGQDLRETVPSNVTTRPVTPTAELA
jgi:hypothetical protein